MNTTRAMYCLTAALSISSVAACSRLDTHETMPLNAANQDRYASGPDRLFVNARHPSGKQVNGTLLDGRQANGRQVDGAFEANSARGEPVSLVFADKENGTTYKGAGLVGIEVSGHISDGSVRPIRFADHDSTTLPGVNLYLVKYVDRGESVCGDLDGQPIWAAILPQQYDETTGSERASDKNLYTFSCRFGAIQKCQELGYIKNGTAQEMRAGVSRARNLNDYHAACVKMMQADYCGNGVTHAFDGAGIDIYDHLENGNVAETGTTGQDGFYFEADWDQDGAHCLNITRWMPATLGDRLMNQSSANPDWEYVRVHCPERFAFPVSIGSGGMSVPDRACGLASNWNTAVGYSIYSSGSPTQPGRSKIRTNVLLNKYTY
jgi:hypothetical protein